MPPNTRERILGEAMRLFGEHGYRATRVAEIEEAAGLSPGSGALYKHFRSKADLLAAGVNELLATGDDLFHHLDSTETADDDVPLEQRLQQLVRTSLERHDRGRDLTRLIVRDLSLFPDLMAEVREREIQRFTIGAAAWLARQAGAGDATDRDWSAIATVFTGAVSNYWLLRDAFGQHPSGVTDEEFVAATTALALALIERDGGDR